MVPSISKRTTALALALGAGALASSAVAFTLFGQGEGERSDLVVAQERVVAEAGILGSWLGEQALAGLQALSDAFRIQLRFRVSVAGTPLDIPFDQGGLSLLQSALLRFHPGTRADGSPAYLDSGTWQLVQRLAQPAFRKQFEWVASTYQGEVRSFTVTVYLDDSPYGVDAGDFLVPQPDGTTRTEAYGGAAAEPFWAFLQRHGTTLTEVHALNGRKIKVSAARRRRRGQPDDVILGEPRLLVGGALDDFLATLLHEAGHVGDGSSCGVRNADRYGPDGSHYFHEVLTPAAAFTEGWADYVALPLPGKYQRGYRTQLVEIEGSEAGDYHPIAPGDLTVADVFSVEARVAQVLKALEDRFGKQALVTALRDTHHVSCRTLATFVLAFLQQDTDRLAEVLQILIQVAGNVGTIDDYRAFVLGQIPYPGGQPGPFGLPRERPVSAGGAAPTTNQTRAANESCAEIGDHIH